MKLTFNWRFHRAVQKLYKDSGFWKLWKMKRKKGTRSIKETWEQEVYNTISALPQEEKKLVMRLCDLYAVEIMKDINYVDSLDTVQSRARLLEIMRIKNTVKNVYAKKEKQIEKEKGKELLSKLSRKQ